MDTHPTGQQIIAGGESVPVATRSGEARELFVRQLRPSELGSYLTAEAHGELMPLVLTTGHTLEELDELSLDSVEALIAADARQNFSFARRHEKRRAEVVARQLEGLRAQSPEAYARVQAQLAQLMPSPALSPAQPAAAAAGVSPPA